jgi:hypothetical protein
MQEPRLGGGDPLQFPWAGEEMVTQEVAQKSFKFKPKDETARSDKRQVNPSISRIKKKSLGTRGSNSQATELLHNKDAEQYYKDQ